MYSAPTSKSLIHVAVDDTCHHRGPEKFGGREGGGVRGVYSRRNREGRNQVVRSPVSRRSTQSYVLTCSRLIGKREPLTAMGAPAPGSKVLHFCLRGIPSLVSAHCMYPMTINTAVKKRRVWFQYSSLYTIVGYTSAARAFPFNSSCVCPYGHGLCTRSCPTFSSYQPAASFLVIVTFAWLVSSPQQSDMYGVMRLSDRSYLGR